jgi:predicted Ser/Thr protein kinase
MAQNISSSFKNLLNNFDKEQFQTLNSEMSFSQYIDLLKEKPSLLRTSWQTIYEMILEKGCKQVEEYRKSNFTASFSNSLQNTQRVFNENPPRSPHVFGGSFIKSKEPLQV